MDERTVSLLEQFKRRGALLIFGPALIVATLVAVGLGAVMIRSYGQLTASGIGALAVSSLGIGGIDDPTSQEHFEAHIAGLVQEGAFISVKALGPDGQVIAQTGTAHDAQAALTPTQRDALRHGKVTTTVRVAPSGDGYALHITAPLRFAAGQPPVAVIDSMRPFSVISTNFLGTIGGFVLVVLFGAVSAYSLLRRMIRAAEAEMEQQEQQLERLQGRIASSLSQFEQHTVGTLQALTAAVDARDSYTAQHSLHVADYSVAIARQMGLDDEVDTIERAGLLHDVGKIGVHEASLLKPTRLTPKEYADIKEHSAIGARIVGSVPFLEPVVDIIKHHHESWDGSGYPDGLSGDAIPLCARVLAVADAFDAMTSDRPYRRGLTLAKARRELIIGSGSQFDPKVVDALLTALDTQIIELREEYVAESA